MEAISVNKLTSGCSLCRSLLFPPSPHPLSVFQGHGFLTSPTITILHNTVCFFFFFLSSFSSSFKYRRLTTNLAETTAPRIFCFYISYAFLIGNDTMNTPLCRPKLRYHLPFPCFIRIVPWSKITIVSRNTMNPAGKIQTRTKRERYLPPRISDYSMSPQDGQRGRRWMRVEGRKDTDIVQIPTLLLPPTSISNFYSHHGFFSHISPGFYGAFMFFSFSSRPFTSCLCLLIWALNAWLVYHIFESLHLLAFLHHGWNIAPKRCQSALSTLSPFPHCPHSVLP